MWHAVLACTNLGGIWSRTSLGGIWSRANSGKVCLYICWDGDPYHQTAAFVSYIAVVEIRKAPR